MDNFHILLKTQISPIKNEQIDQKGYDSSDSTLYLQNISLEKSQDQCKAVFFKYNNKIALSMEIEVTQSNQQGNNSAPLRKIPKKKLRKQRQSSWTLKQQISYVQFLKKNSIVFKSRQSRKKHKVFKQIADIIGTRSSIQVKSHHQKLQQKYNSTYNIILNVGNQIKKRLSQPQNEKKPNVSERITDFLSFEKIYCPLQGEDIVSEVPSRLIKFIFEDESQNYDPISACIFLDGNQPLI